MSPRDQFVWNSRSANQLKCCQTDSGRSDMHASFLKGKDSVHPIEKIDPAIAMTMIGFYGSNQKVVHPTKNQSCRSQRDQQLISIRPPLFLRTMNSPFLSGTPRHCSSSHASAIDG